MTAAYIYERTPDGGFAPAKRNGPGAKYVNWGDTDGRIAAIFGVSIDKVRAERPAGRDVQVPAKHRDPVRDAHIPDERVVTSKANFGAGNPEPETTGNVPSAVKGKKGKKEA